MTARGTSASRARSVASLCRPSGRSFVRFGGHVVSVLEKYHLVVFNNNGTTILSG
jgi:hypothetical protein